MIVVLIYVDDLLICGNDEVQIDHLKDMLTKSFHMKDLGPIGYFLGLKVDKTYAGFFLSEQKYTRNLIAENGLQGAKALKLPLDSSLEAYF